MGKRKRKEIYLAEKVELIPIEKISPYERNPKVHTPRQINNLVKWIKEVGFVVPVLLDKNNVLIAGHGRYEAARKLGLDKVPALRVEHLTEEQVQAFRIADNKIAESPWDSQLLQTELEQLYVNDVDFISLGFEKKEIDEFLMAFEALPEFDRDKEEREKEAVQLYQGEEAPKEHALPEEEMKVPFYDWLKGMKTIYCFFSGGKDSMAMVADLLNHEVPRDKMVLLHMRVPLDHEGLDEWVEEFAEGEGLKVEMIGEKLSDEQIAKFLRKHGLPYSFATRWCVRKWKDIPFQRWVNQKRLKGAEDVVLCQGFRREEGGPRGHAAERAIRKDIRLRIARPILNYTKEEVFRVIKERGWEPHPVYKYLDRLGCVYCFAVKRREWVTMRKHMPEAFNRALWLLAEAACSPNMKDEIFKNIFRKMMGLPTLESQRKKDRLN